MEFYPCARPGRSGETTDDVPDEVVDKWASGLPKPKTPAPLDGPRRHCPALRAAAGPGCTWARPALKTRSSPNGSATLPGRIGPPGHVPGPCRAVFSRHITPALYVDKEDRKRTAQAALRGSQAGRRVFRAGLRAPGNARGSRFPPRNRCGRERYPTLRRPQPTPRVTSAASGPDTTTAAPPPMSAPAGETQSCRRLPDPPWGRPSTADNLGHLRNPPPGGSPPAPRRRGSWTHPRSPVPEP